ncbi:MAG: HAD hydrolase-like protein, partial [Thermoproteota archaeon]
MTTSRERGIIFDLDGVLVDSMPAHIDAWISAFRQVAGVSLDRRLFYELEGMRGIELVEKVLAEQGKKDIALAEKVVKEKDRIFHSKTLPPPFEGVKDMV